jgi:uncharacterized integral membrane protein (TIGR00698 family)
MSTTTVDTDEERFEETFPSKNVLAYVPGVLLLIGIGLLGKYGQIGWNAVAKHQGWTVPDIEYVLWAILIGLLITNTVGVHRVFRPGVQTYEFWLKIGIVALGSRFVLGDVAKLGGYSLLQILVDMAVAGTIVILAARFFGLSGKLGSLLAIGTSICGVSAIIASKGAIRARNSDVSYAIAAILALGAVALFTLPALGHLIGLTDDEFGLWAGLAVDNTAETTATGYLFSEEAGKIAVLVKSVRNALIGFVVLGFALYWAARGEADQGEGLLRLGQVPQVRPRLSRRLGDRHGGLAHQGSEHQPGQRVQVGVPAHVRGRRPQHQLPRTGANRLAAAAGRRHRPRRRGGRLTGSGAADLAGARLGPARLTRRQSAGGSPLMRREQQIVVSGTVHRRLAGRPREVLSDLDGDQAQFDVVALRLPTQELECGVGGDAVDDHEHSLGLFDDRAVLGDLRDRRGDLVLRLLRRREVDVEAVGPRHATGVLDERVGHYQHLVSGAVGVDDAVVGTGRPQVSTGVRQRGRNLVMVVGMLVREHQFGGRGDGAGRIAVYGLDL